MYDSYNRHQQLTSNIANGVCQHLTMDGVVCPPEMCNGLFMTAQETALTTTLVLHQQRIHFLALAFNLCNILHICLQDLTMLVISQTPYTTKSVASLPQKYTNVPLLALKMMEFTVPAYKPLHELKRWNSCGLIQ